MGTTVSQVETRQTDTALESLLLYWIAYRHVYGRLIKQYIGMPAKVIIARLEELADDPEKRLEDEIAFVSQKVASRSKWLMAFEHKRICELF
jgi:hypothetical protein